MVCLESKRMNWFRRNKHRIKDECCAESLSAYLDCELSAEERAALERHLVKCEDCRWKLETLRQTVEWTRDCAPVRLPRVFTIPVETAAPKAVKARRPAWALPVLQGATALVAVLFIFVVAGDLFLGGSAPRSASQPQMVALQATAVMDQATTAQQVEVTQVVEYAVVAPTVAVRSCGSSQRQQSQPRPRLGCPRRLRLRLQRRRSWSWQRLSRPWLHLSPLLLARLVAWAADPRKLL